MKGERRRSKWGGRGKRREWERGKERAGGARDDDEGRGFGKRRVDNSHGDMHDGQECSFDRRTE